MEDYILQVKGLKTYFSLDAGTLKAVDDVTFDLRRDETIGIIGESGCGKSVTAHSILRTVQKPGRILSGQILYNSGDGTVDLAQYGADSKEMRRLRGSEISMVFQEPMASFSPVYTVGAQMLESVLTHQEKKDKKKARDLCLEMLTEVGMPNPERTFHSFPHQLSGGQCQRAMIAMAMVNRPKILIADEPTTALDVTVQAQITDLMKRFQREYHMSIIYITHDMGVIAGMADAIAVMYLGRVVEYADVKTIFRNPLHPYTRGLLQSMPMLGKKTNERLFTIEGNVPVPLDPPNECGFYSRCNERSEDCGKGIPPLVEVEPGHLVRCFHRPSTPGK